MQPTDADPTPQGTAGDGVALAFGNAIGSSFLFGLLGVLLGTLQPAFFYVLGFAVLGFGAAQIPGVIYFGVKNKNEPEKLKGLIITASILFLLNAGCWGLLITPRWFR
jgi:hypothetical protein